MTDREIGRRLVVLGALWRGGDVRCDGQRSDVDRRAFVFVLCGAGSLIRAVVRIGFPGLRRGRKKAHPTAQSKAPPSMENSPIPRSSFQSPAATASLLRASDGWVGDTRNVAAACSSQRRSMMADDSLALTGGQATDRLYVGASTGVHVSS